jgi:hypothetical protein
MKQKGGELDMTQNELLSLRRGAWVYSVDFQSYARVVEVGRKGFVLAFDRDLCKPAEEVKARPDLGKNEVFYRWESDPEAFSR